MNVEFEDMVRNVRTVIARASERERAEGLTWYQTAHDLAATLAESRGARGRGRSRSVQTWAAIIAVLSPQTSWETNVALAVETAREGEALGGTFGLNVAKANAILAARAADPLTVRFESEVRGTVRLVKAISGDKVTAFYKLIFDPTNAWDVCIDRHAVHIALGQTLGNDERNNYLRRTTRRDNYRLVSDAYRAAAAAEGILPSQAQAIAWVVWRNELLAARKKV